MYRVGKKKGRHWFSHKSGSVCKTVVWNYGGNAVIKSCGCAKECKYQDNVYGKGIRVFTEKKCQKPGQQQGTCTVCGEEKTFVTKEKQEVVNADNT